MPAGIDWEGEAVDDGEGDVDTDSDGDDTDVADGVGVGVDPADDPVEPLPHPASASAVIRPATTPLVALIDLTHPLDADP